MAPYLRTVKSFADVNTNGGVETIPFLEAAKGLVGLFGAPSIPESSAGLVSPSHPSSDLLGSKAFAVVQSDLNGNIAKVKARYDAAPDKSRTLESLVENEKGEKKRTATEGLLWLLRGLSFTCKALQHAQANKSDELTAAFTKSYELTLKQHHNFVVKGIFAVAMKACPYRADFFAKLAADEEGGKPATQEEVNTELEKWLTALSAIVKQVQDFYEKEGHNKGF